MEQLGPILRRGRRRERPGWRALLALAASLLLNLLALSRIDASFLGLGKAKPVRPVDLAPLSALQWEANRAVRPPGAAPAPAVAPAPVPPPPDPALKQQGQVVDLGQTPPPDPSKKPPKETRFLAEHDSVVDKETRSRHARAGYENVLPVPASPTAAQRPGQDGKASRAVEGKEGEKGEQRRQAERLALAPPPDQLRAPSLDGPGDAARPVPAIPPEAAQAEAPAGAGEGGQRLQGRLDPRLALPASTLSRLAGGPAPDHLKDVEEGEGTYLNAKEFKFATYMNQVKRSVVRTWHPDVAYQKRDPDFSLYPQRDRFTLLAVTLDETGHMKDAVVEKRSGLDFLDQAAVDAIREAQPFLNPPHGMVENGEVKFSFGFMFSMSSDRPRVQIFRNAPAPY
ncbi:MAG TPA: TonB family protein [Anaeromyxobacteraceae bacterium]|nr:TonB family protein [Anaeromyxobacteraceae bacterium]